MLDKDSKFNLVNDSLPSIIRSSWTLKAVSVIVQHGVGVYLMFNINPVTGISFDHNCNFSRISTIKFRLVFNQKDSSSQKG